MTQIMKAHVIQTGAVANSAPWLLQIDKMRAGSVTDNHEGIAFHLGQRLQDISDRRREIDRFGTRL